MQKNNKEYDIIVAGGGIAGLATAYGLCEKTKGLRIAVVDAPTQMNKASRTNVGLLWCQSKFLHEPDFARWGFMSCRLFPELLKDLQSITKQKIDVYFKGGLIPTLGEEEYQTRGDYIDGLRNVLGEYNGGMINRAELERKLPKIAFGADVSGAAWCEEDGVVDPLALLRSYRIAIQNLGADFYDSTEIHDITHHNYTSYTLATSIGTFQCNRLVLAGGLANKRLANFAIQSLPIFADKGQVLLTERLPMVMPIPVLGCTQTFGGTVIIGFKHETRGHDATVVPHAVAQEGLWALRVWPELGQKRIIRTWPGLRVMPDDKVAIYSHLPKHPQVTLINTHSAVTLAAVHSRYIPDLVMGNDVHECAANMTLKRFGFDC